MAKVVSSRGMVVDFEMMKIMNDINSPKASNVPRPKKLYELPEEEIPYVDSFTTEELLKKHLDNIPKVETVNQPAETLKVETPVNVIEVTTVEEPVPLIISEPIINELDLMMGLSETGEPSKDSNNEKSRRR